MNRTASTKQEKLGNTDYGERGSKRLKCKGMRVMAKIKTTDRERERGGGRVS